MCWYWDVFLVAMSAVCPVLLVRSKNPNTMMCTVKPTLGCPALIIWETIDLLVLLLNSVKILHSVCITLLSWSTGSKKLCTTTRLCQDMKHWGMILCLMVSSCITSNITSCWISYDLKKNITGHKKFIFFAYPLFRLKNLVLSFFGGLQPDSLRVSFFILQMFGPFLSYLQHEKMLRKL